MMSPSRSGRNDEIYHFALKLNYTGSNVSNVVSFKNQCKFAWNWNQFLLNCSLFP